MGFSNGWAALALKNPPPLVPSILIATCDATGPCATDCWAGCPAAAADWSSDVAAVYGWKFWTIPWPTRKTA